MILCYKIINIFCLQNVKIHCYLLRMYFLLLHAQNCEKILEKLGPLAISLSVLIFKNVSFNHSYLLQCSIGCDASTYMERFNEGLMSQIWEKKVLWLPPLLGFTKAQLAQLSITSYGMSQLQMVCCCYLSSAKLKCEHLNHLSQQMKFLFRLILC